MRKSTLYTTDMDLAAKRGREVLPVGMSEAQRNHLNWLALRFLYARRHSKRIQVAGGGKVFKGRALTLGTFLSARKLNRIKNRDWSYLNARINVVCARDREYWWNEIENPAPLSVMAQHPKKKCFAL